MNLGILLRTPFQELVDHIHHRLADEGYPEIRPSHGVVFQFIGKEGKRLTELAAMAQITKQSMSYLLEYLERHGHVERIGDEGDNRAWIFRLTRKGWKAVAIAEKAIADFESHYKKELGAKKYNELLKLLSELNTVLAKDKRS